MDERSNSNLWQRITSRDALQMAWAKVQANRGSPGGDGVSLDEFAEDLFGQISELRAELLAGSYRSGPFRKVSILKRKPGYRILPSRRSATEYFTPQLQQRLALFLRLGSKTALSVIAQAAVS